MKTSSASSDRPPLERSRAWACLALNALVCPGLGSLMARHRSGWPQLALSWGGAIWMVVVLVKYFGAWLRLRQEPPDGADYLNSGLLGLVLFLAGWSWAIATGIVLVRQARPRMPAVQPGEFPSSVPPAKEPPAGFEGGAGI